VTVLVLADLAAMGLAWVALVSVRSMGTMGAMFTQMLDAVFPVGFLHVRQFALALIVGLALTGNYGSGDQRRSSSRISLGVSLAAGLQLWASLWIVAFGVIVTEYIATVLAMSLLIVVFRRSVDAMLRRIYKMRGASGARVILVGSKADCERMAGSEALDGSHGMTVVRAISTDDLTEAQRLHKIHPVHELEYYIHASRAETVVLCGYPGVDAMRRVVKAALAAGCHVLSWNPNFDVLGAQPAMSWRGGQPFIEWHAPTLRWRQQVAKRVMDVVLASAGLVVLSPVMAAVAIAVKLTSPGPTLFGHLRLGRFGRGFRCLKFRSMYSDAEQRLRADPELYSEYVRNDFKLPTEKDARITPLGRFLRRTSLDELPQLLNVVRGDMSLVGPRPIVPDELCLYEDDGPLLFLSLRPGITGAWQVSGRSSVSYPERARIEVDYVQTWSFAKDVELLIRTVPAVVAQRGAH
jgi:exopolysaccharide biosynthesis polyprenyl glycosylphosphotransferase